MTTLTIDASTASSGVVTVSAAAVTSANNLDVNVSSSGHGAADSIVLGAGNDTVRVDNDSLATANAQTITGGSGTDTLSVKTGTATTVTLGAGLTGFETVTLVTAGVNYDFTAVDGNVASGATLTLNGSAITGTVRWIGSAETNGFLALTGGTGADTLTGGSKADTITGGSGADVITGGSGADNLTGGQGADVFVFSAVTDSGGTTLDTITDYLSGTDKLNFTLDYSLQSSGLTVDGTILTAAAGVTNAQATLSGNRGQIIYDTDNSKLYINVNNDNLITSLDYSVNVNAGSTAASTVASGDINLTITGSSGADSIMGGGGADSITGGEGTDTITGGNGNDAIFLAETSAVADTVVFTGTAITSAGGNADTVSSYASGTDILTFGSTFLQDTAFGSAQTVTSDVASTAAGIAGAAGDSIILVLSDSGTTVADIAAMFSSDFTSAMHSVVIQYDGAADSNIYFVGGDLDGTSTNGVATAEVVLIGTLSAVDLSSGVAQAMFGSAV